MRILALTRYGSLGASSRVRFYQYIPFLKSCGVEIHLANLLDDEYVRNLYNGKSQSVFPIFRAFISRASKLLNRNSYDLLWIEKQLFPWFPTWIENFLAKLDIPYVVDFDDAVFHRYDLHQNRLVRALLGKSIDGVMRNANIVVVGNDYLAERARLAGARMIENLPSVVDVSRYSIHQKSEDQFRIGWIGSPVTAPYLELIREALYEVTRQINSRLVLVGVGNYDPLPGIEKDSLDWAEDKEASLIQSFDVGIMPLPDGPFEKGKCGYKLVQYMACGIPVIASPVGVNSRIVEHGKTGFLASNTAEWVQSLVLLSKNLALSKKFGKAGRNKIEREYCLQITAPRLLDILSRAAAWGKLPKGTN